MIIPKNKISRFLELVDLYIEAAEDWQAENLGDDIEMFRQIRDHAELALSGDGTGLKIEVSYENS